MLCLEIFLIWKAHCVQSPFDSSSGQVRIEMISEIRLRVSAVQGWVLAR